MIKKRKSPFKKLFKLLFTGFLIVFSLRFAVSSIEKADFFKIKTIFLYSEIEVDNNNLISLSSGSIFKLHTKKIESDLYSKNPDFKKVSVKKNFPNSITIIISKRIPLAIATQGVLTEALAEGEATGSALIKYGFERNEGPEFLIDSNGYLFNKNDMSLPVIGLDLQNKKAGDRISSPTVLFMLQVLQGLTEKPAWIVNSDNKVVLFGEDGSIVILDSKKSIEEQLSSLQLIWNRFRIEGRKFEYLDLRFQKPVVKFLKE